MRDTLGAQGTSNEFQVFDGFVRVPNMVAVTGGWAEVPVLLERLTPGNELSSFQMRLSYDSTYMRFDALLTSGTLTGTWTPTFHSSPPVLTIAGATAGSLSATGVLLKLRFAVKPSLSTGIQAAVRLEQLLFNEGLPFVDTQDGIITVAGVPVASSLWSPGDGWTGQPVTPQLHWNGVAYTETYHLQVATDSSFSSLVVNDSTLTVTWTSVGPLASGTVHYWRVRARNSVGAGPWTSVWQFTTDVLQSVTAEAGPVPTEFGLDRNYPNPFNPGTRIGFRLPEEAWVTLTIYNLRGSEVDRLVGERLPAGAYHIWWNASQLPSGMYIYRMVAGRFTSAQRMLLLK